MVYITHTGRNRPMEDNILSVFNKHVETEFDRKILKKLLTYVTGFVRKNENHINFFGGNLIGLYTAKWLVEDRMVWVEYILDIPAIDTLKQELHSLPGVDASFHVSGDVVNMSFVWAAHKSLVSPHLNKRDQHRLAHACLTMLQYKFLTSIHTHKFPYPASESIALAVYESLDRKSAIKRHGSWEALVNARSDDILSGSSIHFDTLRNFNDDEEIRKMINDIQGRIKSILNNLTDKFYAIKESEDRIGTQGNFKTIKGEVFLKEASNKYERLRERLHDIVPNRKVFIRNDLIDAVVETVSTVSPRQLEETLLYLSDNYTSRKGKKDYQPLMEDIVVFTFDLMRKEGIDLDSVPRIILKLRAILRSSRVNDPMLLSIRERTGFIVEDAIRTKSSSTIASTRIGVILYITLRSLIES